MAAPSNKRDHWNDIYASKPVHELGWYEEAPTPSLDLLSRCNVGKDEAILDVGAGATLLVDALLHRGFTHLIAVDISEVALEHLQVRLRERLGPDKLALVRFIVDDLTRPGTVGQLRDIAVWHDRAVLHFLVDEADRQAYLATLKAVVRSGGCVIIAAFANEGAPMCSGLPVRRYDEQDLAEFLGPDFTLLEHFRHLYRTPADEPRPYVYTLFRRA